MWSAKKDKKAPAPPRPSSLKVQQLQTPLLESEEEYEAQHVLQGHEDFVRSVQALNDVCVASSADDKTIKLWNSTTGQLIGTLEGHSTWVACLCPLEPRTDADPDDPVATDQFMASGSFDTSIKVWNTRTGECVSTLEGHSDCARCLAVIPEQPHCIVSGGYDNAIKVWDYLDGECIQTLQEGHMREVTCLCPLPSYDKELPPRLVSGSADASIKIWDVESGRCVQMLVGHKDYVRAVVALPPPPPTKWGWQEALQGRLVSASGDGSLRVWCVKTGKTLQTLKGHTAPVQCVAALQGGGRVVSGSFDQTLRLWDPQSGSCLQVLTGHTHRIRTVAALPDGRLVSGADDMTVRVWKPAGMQVPTQAAQELRDSVPARKPYVMTFPATQQQKEPRSPSTLPVDPCTAATAQLEGTLRTVGMLVNGLTRRGLEALLGAEEAAAVEAAAAAPAEAVVEGVDLGLISPEEKGEQEQEHGASDVESPGTDGTGSTPITSLGKEEEESRVLREVEERAKTQAEEAARAAVAEAEAAEVAGEQVREEEPVEESERPIISEEEGPTTTTVVAGGGFWRSKAAVFAALLVTVLLVAASLTVASFSAGQIMTPAVPPPPQQQQLPAASIVEPETITTQLAAPAKASAPMQGEGEPESGEDGHGVTHRDPTCSPLQQAGGQVLAELAAAVEYEDNKEEALAEMLLEERGEGEEAPHHDEWDVSRLSSALSSARVSSIEPLRPKTRAPPSVNTGARSFKREEEAEEEGQVQAATQFDPTEEAEQLVVLEHRIARRPRGRRPLLARIVLAPLMLAVDLAKLPFRILFAVLKAVAWPFRVVLRI